VIEICSDGGRNVRGDATSSDADSGRGRHGRVRRRHGGVSDAVLAGSVDADCAALAGHLVAAESEGPRVAAGARGCLVR
jgi:hypothetical protein